MNLDAFLGSPVGGLLASAGQLALLWRLLRALVRSALGAAESTATGGLLEVSIRRGDLTGMAERREQLSRARRARSRSIAEALLCFAALVVPVVAGIARPVYAAAALLWLVPRRRRVRRLTAAEPGNEGIPP